MTELAAVGALHFGPVLWLGTVLGKVTLLLTVAAGYLCWVGGLRALLSHVLGRITVPTSWLLGALQHVSEDSVNGRY